MLTARFGGQIALTDGLIHHHDIRRSRRSQGPDTVQRHTDLADATGSAG
jgi:hypothetical protein